MLGSGGGAQEFSEEQVRLWLTGKVKQVSLFCIPSGTMGTLSSEISMRFGLRGMSHVITTGCTSSTDAFGYALRQIQFGFLPMMLVGGVDAPIAPGIMKGFTLMKIMTASWNDAPERASRPFSARPRRLRGRRRLVDVLPGRVRTCASARARRFWPKSPVMARPARPFIASACRSAARNRRAPSRWRWRMPGSAANDINYVNLHGTSTQLNDRIETRALKLALGDKAYRTPMSSLKSQIGHPQGACGAAGIAATLIAMHHRQIPPTINLEKPDPECDLDYVPEAGRQVEIEHAVCNCIAFGSKNSALVLRKIT